MFGSRRMAMHVKRSAKEYGRPTHLSHLTYLFTVSDIRGMTKKEGTVWVTNDEGVYLCLLGTLQNKSRLVMEGTISQLYYQYLVLTY